jgi:transcriptional regulator with XRE-family HTH domain
MAAGQLGAQQPGRGSVMATDETLGALLRRLRAAAGFATPEELAARCGVPPFRLRDWERDRRAPDLVSAYRLAQSLNVPLEQLAACLHRQAARGPKAHLTTAPPRRRTGRKLPGKPRRLRRPER